MFTAIQAQKVVKIQKKKKKVWVLFEAQVTLNVLMFVSY